MQVLMPPGGHDSLGQAHFAEQGYSEKMCGSMPAMLNYGSRQEFVSGLDALIDTPLLTMEDEFRRTKEWTDRKGVTYSLAAEWAYVNGRACRSEGHTAGTRDDGWNHGKTVDEFLARANGEIERRRQSGQATSMLPEGHFQLTRDEVLAVRLYTGPSYQPINDFLRQVGLLSGDFRSLAREPRFTFAATIGHLCQAIRKLAAIATLEEAQQKLYRGVRGELPRGFWTPDELGMIVAVDYGFMSTSRSIDTPLDYMAEDGANVMWELCTRPESNNGYHLGADVSMLSQFASEEEVLFPPCTMLTLMSPAEHNGADPSTPAARANSKRLLRGNTMTIDIPPQCELRGKKMHFLRVEPTFT